MLLTLRILQRSFTPNPFPSLPSSYLCFFSSSIPFPPLNNNNNKTKQNKTKTKTAQDAHALFTPSEPGALEKLRVHSLSPAEKKRNVI